MERNQIIEALVELLRGDKHVHALWLEGSDATGKVDSYSDIDICASIDAEAIDTVFEKIQAYFMIDSIHENRPNDSERQLVFHIVNTDKYHMVDFNAYVYGVAGTTFVSGDMIDTCKVIFDKDGIIQYKEYDPDDGAGERTYWKEESAYRFSQISRVEKYCLRGLYPVCLIFWRIFHLRKNGIRN